MKRAPSEGVIQAEIVSTLTGAGYVVLRLQCGLAKGWKGGRMTLCPPGTPDLLVVGRCFLETKTESGKLRPSQVKMHEAIRRFGGVVVTVRTPGEALDAVRAVRT